MRVLSGMKDTLSDSRVLSVRRHHILFLFVSNYIRLCLHMSSCLLLSPFVLSLCTQVWGILPRFSTQFFPLLFTHKPQHPCEYALCVCVYMCVCSFKQLTLSLSNLSNEAVLCLESHWRGAKKILNYLDFLHALLWQRKRKNCFMWTNHWWNSFFTLKTPEIIFEPQWRVGTSDLDKATAFKLSIFFVNYLILLRAFHLWHLTILSGQHGWCHEFNMAAHKLNRCILENISGGLKLSKWK